MRALIRHGAALATAVILASATGALAQAPKKGGVLNFSVVAEPPNYDCHASTTFALIHPIAPHYSTLLKFDTANYPKVTGDLAKSWTVSADGKVFTFKLHEGVKFHDGSAFSSADIRASYERIARPPQGVVSARKSFWAALDTIQTPDAATAVFTFKQPVASMTEHFANPYNCVYSAAKLAQNPKYPETEIMGTGAFTFVGHTKGQTWEGKRFDGYFRQGRPHLDGYKAFFVKSPAVVPGMLGGQFDIEFRGRNPAERDQLMKQAPDRFTLQEGTWIGSLMLIFNTTRKPFDDIRVRQALSLAIDRWGGSDGLSKISILKGVGGIQRPGAELALPESELVKLPGFSKDIAASRAQAQKLLAEAGVKDLQLKLLNRNVAEPYTPAGVFVVDQLKRIGVNAAHEQLETKLYFDGVRNGTFDVAVEFVNDPNDDPTQQFAKYPTKKISTIGYSGHTDEKLDAMYVKQQGLVNVAERRAAVHELEKYAITTAYNVPLHWYHRIIVGHKKIKGWHFTPSHYVGQDLVDVWLDQ